MLGIVIIGRPKLPVLVVTLLVLAGTLLTAFLLSRSFNGPEVATVPRHTDDVHDVEPPPKNAERAAPELNPIDTALLKQRRSLLVCVSQCSGVGLGPRYDYEFELELQLSPEGRVSKAEILSGTVKEIRRDGSVTERDVTATSRVSRCIAARALEWRVPAFDGAPQTRRWSMKMPDY